MRACFIRIKCMTYMYFQEKICDIKRAESMKVDLKKPKRTPSFTTRRRTQSFRKLQKLEQLDQLPPVEIQGILDRKHELQSGGKKAAVRSWKTLYTVLCGQLLCFFKDQDDFLTSRAATSPIIIFKAKCEKAEDYTKRKYVFRLCCTDGSEFLFLTSSESEMEDWINKISFHAQLPPSLQLLSYDENHKGSPGVDRLPPLSGGDVSSSSSHSSTPELTRRRSTSGAQGAHHHRNSTSSGGASEKPPVIPPRSAPPPVPVKTSSGDVTAAVPSDNSDHNIPIQMRSRHDGIDNTNAGRLQSYQGNDSISTSHHNGDTRSHSTADIPAHHGTEMPPPPLPVSAPPNRSLPHREPWPTDVNSYRHGTVYGNLTAAQRPVSAGGNATNIGVVYGNNRSATLPCYVPPPAPSTTYQAHVGDQRRQSESSSESEQPSNAARKDKRSNVLSNLFRKKRATNL